MSSTARGIPAGSLPALAEMARASRGSTPSSTLAALSAALAVALGAVRHCSLDCSEELPEIDYIYIPEIAADQDKLFSAYDEYSLIWPCENALTPKPGVYPDKWPEGGGRYDEVRRYARALPRVQKKGPWWAQRNLGIAGVNSQKESLWKLKGVGHHCGCSLSHFVVWMSARERGVKNLVVAESDGLPSYWFEQYVGGEVRDFATVLAKAIRGLPEGWDLLQLDKGLRGAGRHVARLRHTCWAVEYDVYTWGGMRVAGTALYMVSASFLKRIPNILGNYSLDMVDAWLDARCESDLRCYSISAAAKEETYGGAPFHGVRYVPHAIGEAYPKAAAPESDAYSWLRAPDHSRDRSRLEAFDTLLLLTPRHPEGLRRVAADKRVVLTFPFARLYRQIVLSGVGSARLPTPVSPAANIAREIMASVKTEAQNFADLVEKELSGASLAAWTLDTSLDMRSIASTKVKSCDDLRRIDAVAGVYGVYGELLRAVVLHVDRLLGRRRLLLPLDLWPLWPTSVEDHVTFSAFCRCFASQDLGFVFRRSNVSWLLALSPSDGLGSYVGMINATGAGTVLLIGGTRENATSLISSLSSEVSSHNLGGILYDEWMDDWARSDRGPFLIATAKPEDMDAHCIDGSDFEHDGLNCARGNDAQRPEFSGLHRTVDFLGRRCVYLSSDFELACSGPWALGALLALFAAFISLLLLRLPKLGVVAPSIDPPILLPSGVTATFVAEAIPDCVVTLEGALSAEWLESHARVQLDILLKQQAEGEEVQRILENARAWCEAGGRETPPCSLAEVFLYRVIASLAEHMLHCPERIAFLWWQSASRSPGTAFHLRLPELLEGHELVHDGLLNFDDVNDAACRASAPLKTFRESRGLAVALDLLVNHRGVIAAKTYLFLAMSLRSFELEDAGGDWIVYDAAAWASAETAVSLWRAWQWWPSIGTGTPGSPRRAWFLTRALSGASGLVFLALPGRFRIAWAYCALRMLTLVLVHWPRPWPYPRISKQAPVSRQRILSTLLLSALVVGGCAAFEYFCVLPALPSKGWVNLCASELTGHACGEFLDYKCAACSLSSLVSLAQVASLLIIDVYVVFCIVTGLVSLALGHAQAVADVINVDGRLDLRDPILPRLFGADWRERVWKPALQKLHEDCLLDDAKLSALASEEELDLAAVGDACAMRLSFFVRSLAGLEATIGEQATTLPAPSEAPSLTQIIPVYRETMLPTLKYLTEREGETPLQFLAAQHAEEWTIFSDRHNVDLAAAHQLPEESPLAFELRVWCAMRSQCVFRTLRGILSYFELGAQGEVLLTHQLYGQLDHDDFSVDEVLKYFWHKGASRLFLVLDLNPRSRPDLLLQAKALAGPASFYSAKAQWFPSEEGERLRLLQVLPRAFPLRLGRGADKTNGKAANQTNALRFASGRYLQALDSNMGMFSGEALKIPAALALMAERGQPLLGFREYIFTWQQGTVAASNASAEWTFNTNHQRALAWLGVRMHYGHPDFLEGAWALSRGGMSKPSVQINLSEDVFLGIMLHLRGEQSGHVDFLEFDKGKECTVHSSTLFYTKIASGWLAMMRSRDYQALYEHSSVALLSYLSTTAYYVSHVASDASLRLYVYLYVFSETAGVQEGVLSAVGSALGTEWIISLGALFFIQHFMELSFEGGVLRAFLHSLLQSPWTAIFGIFQVRTMAAAAQQGALLSKASYSSSGRPLAMETIGWREAYRLYGQSHYTPAIDVLFVFLVYRASGRTSDIAMFFVLGAMVTWLAAPMLLSPPETNWRRESRGLLRFALSLEEDGLLAYLSNQDAEAQRATKIVCALNSAATCLVIVAVSPSITFDYLLFFAPSVLLALLAVLGFRICGYKPLLDLSILFALTVPVAAWFLAHHIHPSLLSARSTGWSCWLAISASRAARDICLLFGRADAVLQVTLSLHFEVGRVLLVLAVDVLCTLPRMLLAREVVLFRRKPSRAFAGSTETQQEHLEGEPEADLEDGATTFASGPGEAENMIPLMAASAMPPAPSLPKKRSSLATAPGLLCCRSRAQD